MRILNVAFAISLVTFPATGQATDEKSNEKFQVGQRAPAGIVARFATGPWAARKTKSACPVLINRQETKIAIFARQLSSDVLRLAVEVDKLVAEDAQLKWSFVFVSHENDPTPSLESWEAQLAEFPTLATKHDMNHLSLGLMKRAPERGQLSRAKSKLGFPEDTDTVIMLISPSSGTNSIRGTIRHATALKSAELVPETVATITKQLQAAVAALRTGDE